MTVLIAHLSSGKGTWKHVTDLITKGSWSKVLLICNDFAYKSFDITPDKALKLLINEEDMDGTFSKLTQVLKKQLAQEFDVAVNQSSGSGAEHMAVMSAVLKAGVGVRFVYVEDSKIKEFELLDEDYSLADTEEL